MRDLKKFQEKINAYRKNAPASHTQKELAEAISLDKDELSKRLNAYKQQNSNVSPLTHAQVYAIVQVLTRWGAIQTREQAKDLLDLMDCPDFSSSDWKAYPLQRLRSPTGPSTNDLSADRTDTQQKQQKIIQLRMMQIDHTGFLRNRLESFVGRQAELAEIQQLISAMVPTGGYVTITGQAGQGKSSTIARLVDGYGPEKVAHHFIPTSPGPDYQITLLRDIMARLILKHDLSDLYVASESRPVLREFFLKVLVELTGKEKQEVIFIDGLDQLKEDSSNERDLSFLPYPLPPGVVIVLGTRPDDTLHDLKWRIPPCEYRLPNLSRQDFDLMLRHHGVQLDKRLAGRFYRAMQENALYLDLVVKELAHQGERIDPEQIIRRVADNPANIFSLSIERLKRRESQWDKVIYPILGLLLAASEPLMLQHIRQILDIEDYRLKDGLARLGGLAVEDGQQRYSFFHVKLYDYLRQDEDHPGKEYLFAKQEEEQWHKKLAAWCEQGDLSTIWVDIWGDSSEQGRRMYARNHYVTHLYKAREWDKLFEVLDTGHYGRAKLKHNFSMHPFSQDLGLGQQAAASIKEDMLNFLPHLWRYTLLRCSLNSRADQYPPEAFGALVLMKRGKDAIDLARLLTEPEKKAQALLQVAFHLKDEPGWEQEHLQLLDDVYEVIQPVEESEEKGSILHSLCIALIEIQRWDKAEAVAGIARDEEKKTWMLQRLGIALVEAQQWRRAKTIASLIVKTRAGVIVLQKLGTALEQSHQQKRADEVWTEAKAAIHTIEDNDERELALQGLCAEFIKTHQWERASVTAETIENRVDRDRVSRNLCVELAQEQRYEQAEAIAETIQYHREKAMAFLMLGIQFAQANDQSQAERMWARAISITRTIERDRFRGWSLYELGIALENADQDVQAAIIWSEAEALVQSIKESSTKIVMLQELGMALIKAQNLRRAGAALTEAARLVRATEGHQLGAWTLQDLCTYLAQAQQWEEAEAIAQTIEDSTAKAWALRKFCEELALAQQWERAEAIAQTIKENGERARALFILCAELALVQQWDRAEAVWTKIPSINRVIKKESEARASALQNLGVTLVKLEQLAQAAAVMAEAVRTINGIEDTKARSWPLGEFCLSLAQAQQWERAEAMVSEIEDSIAKTWTLTGLCNVLAQAKQWQRAESLVDKIGIDSSKATALQNLSMELSQARQWKRAESALVKAGMLVQKTEGSQEKAWALQRQGIALSVAQKQDQAEVALIEAEAAARTIVEISTRAGVLQEICWALALADRWERAEAIASTIEDSNIKTNILLRLGMALAQTQQWDHAKAIAHKIDQSRARAGVLQNLAMALLNAKQWEQAGGILINLENMVYTIEEPEARAFALLRLGIALAQAGQRERAEIIWKEVDAAADKIVPTEPKIPPLVGFCTLYAQGQEWGHAKIIADLIKSSREKADALLAIGVELVRTKQWTQAEAIMTEVEKLVCDLKNNQDKVILFNRIMDVLEMAGKYERMHHLVQNALQKATSRMYAIHLFALVNRVLPLKPELGIVYCEAFTWVDTFLS